MTFTRVDSSSEWRGLWDQVESRTLAPYAIHTSRSCGRRHPEAPHPSRTDYMRDRDRIIHCAAFRRLMHKTQVFVGQQDDHQRTRLTHTLEVAQIARTLARNLALNEDLTEAVALAHDLGHPPFGHAGERALADLMAGHGGFEHNRQGLRIVERLEQRYPAFDGLNLTYETLESIALHSTHRDHPDLAEFGPELRPNAECQVVDAADSIAYDAHDIDDALRARLIGFDDLRQVELWRLAEQQAREAYGADLEGKQLARAVIRYLIDWQVSDLLAESRSRLERFDSPDEVKSASRDVIALAAPLEEKKRELEGFLFERVYRHEQVVRSTRVAERMVRRLFKELVREPTALPDKQRSRLDQSKVERVVCDYLAGMTDRFAQRRHREFFEP